MSDGPITDSGEQFLRRLPTMGGTRIYIYPVMQCVLTLPMVYVPPHLSSANWYIGVPSDP